MLKGMLFIDFENFDIAKYNYYKNKCTEEQTDFNNPRLDFNTFPQKIIQQLPEPHTLVKTFLFAPKPDSFLMRDHNRQSVYNWITGMKNQDFFSVIEGKHVSRPVYGKQKCITDKSSFYVVEKGTDVNLAVHVLTKAYHNAYDTAIILSADTDYIPVMDVLNHLGKAVVVAGVKQQNLEIFKQHSDFQIVLDDTFFQTCLRT
ncbi:NYN domain-containing protein [uncultured Ruminococcus sp.]|uniref:NYN domain-containing protein n=1 Tax=uncultured Ruminococcus sp. TaxID=165186 RepID=UPI0029311E85|nr:NYN domain-containing protein [uncultured Ruminococcus sp.]